MKPHQIIYSKIVRFCILTVCLASPNVLAEPLIGTQPLTQSYDFSYTYVTSLAEYVQHHIEETQPGRTNL